MNKYRPRRFCLICGKEISGTRRIKTCDSEECIKKYRLLHYKERIKEKKCKYCGKSFNGTNKQTVCEECKKKIRSNMNYETFEQTILCKQCGCEIKKVTKKITNNKILILYETCEKCKEKNRIENSINASNRMKTKNPMFNSEIAKKSGERQRKHYLEKCKLLGITPHPIYKKPEKSETKEETSLRMHLHNPMYNEEIKKRASQTTKRRIENGEITFKRGKENPLWKGNRTLNKHIRINLRKWVRKKFEDSNFTCQENGETNCELQVHHIIPLREIIEEFLKKYNTNSQEILKDENLLDIFTQDIIQYHFDNSEIGIVVCPKCHHKLDKQYRRLTYYHNKE